MGASGRGVTFSGKAHTSAGLAIGAFLAVSLVACGLTVVETYENESGQKVPVDSALSALKAGPTRDAVKAEWQDMSRAERDTICTRFEQASDASGLAALTEALADEPELDPEQMYLGLQLLCVHFRG